MSEESKLLHTGENTLLNIGTIGFSETVGTLAAIGTAALGAEYFEALTELPKVLNFLDYKSSPETGNVLMNIAQAVLLLNLSYTEYRIGDKNDSWVNPIYVAATSAIILSLPHLATQFGEIISDLKNPENLLKAGILAYGIYSSAIRPYVNEVYVSSKSAKTSIREESKTPKSEKKHKRRSGTENGNQSHSLLAGGTQEITTEKPRPYLQLDQASEKLGFTPDAVDIINLNATEEELILLSRCLNPNGRKPHNVQRVAVDIYHRIMKRGEIKEPRDPIAIQFVESKSINQKVTFTSISKKQAEQIKKNK